MENYVLEQGKALKPANEMNAHEIMEAGRRILDRLKCEARKTGFPIITSRTCEQWNFSKIEFFHDDRKRSATDYSLDEKEIFGHMYIEITTYNDSIGLNDVLPPNFSKEEMARYIQYRRARLEELYDI